MLTDAGIRRAPVKASGYRLTDSLGLMLYISKSGKYWRFRYQFGGRERILAIGFYPDMSLAAAREIRDDLRALVRAGRDPAIARRAQRAISSQAAGATFELVAREWHSLQIPMWAPQHAADVIKSLEGDVFPRFGDMPLGEITAPLILEALRAIERRPAVELAHRVLQRISAVFAFAIAAGRATVNPATMIKGALAPVVRGRQPAVTTLDAAREVIAAVEGMRAHPVTKLAHRLLALTVVRPGTLATTPWVELADVSSDPNWTIPAARMKLRIEQKRLESRDHIVPLARQAVEVIEALGTLTGASPFAFPNARFFHRPMSENALGFIVKRAGFHGRHVPHGWRATFSTVMNERDRRDRAVIDLMLAHQPKEKVEAAYNRAAYMAERRTIAQSWADLLLDGMPPASALLVGRRK